MTPQEKLLAHPQPVDKTAALHIASANKHDRDQLLWAQHEAFERALVEVRLHNMAEEQARRHSYRRDEGKVVKGYDEARTHQRKLIEKNPRSFATRDWARHVDKFRKQSPHFVAKMRLGDTRQRGTKMEKFVERVTR